MTGRPIIAEGRTFVDAALDLTGGRVERSVFDGCVLTLQHTVGLVLRNCTITNSQLVGPGWAAVPGAIEETR